MIEFSNLSSNMAVDQENVGAPDAVLELVERFERQLDAYKSGQYHETQLRREFLDPMFRALGWDVDNVQGFAEPYKDVIHEDAIRVGGATKAPDYCFRVGGTRKFFVEAKKPSVDIKEAISPAYQLRRYAWSAKLSLSILSDFEEFAVYDCRVRPAQDDPPATARIFYCTFREYADHWDWLASIFSKAAIQKGTFDQFAESTKVKKGTMAFDEDFLAAIEQWRAELARHLALRNPRLIQRELNFAVQRIIDRIIFLRICEDRGLEDYGRLRALVNGDRIYPRLCQLFEAADARYNSGLFHFRPEPRRHEVPDELTRALDLDDKLLRDILRSLYYPESPYEFSVVSADILGQVYEQFLGKVIRLTEGHRAVVDDKPEVKKAGGVYYTPTYIVDYIVRETVGELAKGKTPKQVAGLRILDPACGSGSFLLGAYQYLLDWHRDWYASHEPAKWAKGGQPSVYQSSGGGWKLTSGERKRILLNNIFGVDIDPQAVEVTKLSLLLKVLEGETEQTLQTIFRLFHERALPDLGENIKCGNSLIGPDFYEQGQLDLLDDAERYRLNVFDWHAEFRQIFRRAASASELHEPPAAWPLDYTMPGVPLHGSFSYKQKKEKRATPSLVALEPEWEGGFDAVIGNPPYGANLSAAELAYLRQRYQTATKDLDTYTLFMEEAVALLRPQGYLSMIVPTGWYSGPKFSALRRLIASRTDPNLFVNLPYDVFKAWVDTTVFRAVKRTRPILWPRREQLPVTIITFPKRQRIASHEDFQAHASHAEFSAWFADGRDEYLTYADAAITAILRKVLAGSRPLSSMADIQRGVTPFSLTEKPVHPKSRPAFSGTVRRYRLVRGERRFVRFDDSLAEPKPERYFQGPRLLLRELISRQFQLQAIKVTEDFITNKSMQSILPLGNAVDLNYLLGVINSRLLSWYFLRRSNIAQRDDFPKIVLKESRCLPIHPINLSDRVEKSRHDRLVMLVDQMLDLHRQLVGARTPQEQTALTRQIAGTDAQIDRLVYELYGLTEQEIRIVESTA